MDTRPQAAFEARHVVGSTHFDSVEFDRLIELPAKAMDPDIGLVCPDNDDARAAAVDWLKKGLYDCRLAVKESEVDWDALTAAGLVESGSTSRRLWSASPTLEACAELLDAQVLAPALASGRRPIALDLGSGAGRDAIFLAQRGWSVHAVDYVDSICKKLQRFAARQRVESLVSSEFMDLLPKNNEDAVGWLLQSRAWDLVNVSRFMHRRVLESLCRYLAPGSWLAIHHFLAGAVSRTGRNFKDQKTLEVGELPEWFGPQYGFDPPSMHVNHWLPDGRPVVSFVVRRAFIVATVKVFPAVMVPAVVAGTVAPPGVSTATGAFSTTTGEVVAAPGMALVLTGAAAPAAPAAPAAAVAENTTVAVGTTPPPAGKLVRVASPGAEEPDVNAPEEVLLVGEEDDEASKTVAEGTAKAVVASTPPTSNAEP